MKKRANNTIKIQRLFLVLALFLFVVIIGRLSFLALAKKVDGIDIQAFAANRTTEKKILTANRGTIYDCNGNVLAQNVFSYTLIAYLDSSRTTDINNPKHVVDKEKTALALSQVINMSYEEILNLLNQKGLYQTEFGKVGQGLTEIAKDKIVELNLPGIDFIETVKRYYPYGDFLSYTIGYVKNYDGVMVGEMGIEKYFNKELSGTNGSVTYQKDRNGYQIPGTKEIRIESVDGNDIYLSIDANIQLFVEQALKGLASQYSFDWSTIIVANAKTGAILANGSSPSFDPNLLNIANYMDPSVSYAVEPGSIMKTYTYMAALETGKYNGNTTFQSGYYIAKDGTKIRDWNRTGWGTITYDYGYAVSSNVGIVDIIKEYLSKDLLKSFFKRMGFGSKTGITLPNESPGEIDFQYETEILNSGFGQGITTTPIQHIQGLTSITNDGYMLRPYIVNKIVDEEGDIVKQYKRKVVAKVASKETTDYIKKLMNDVVTIGIGTGYTVSNVDLIGKTGTGQIASDDGYLQGYANSTRSFTGMFPKEDPQVIVYITVRKPEDGLSEIVKEPFREVVTNVAGYLGIDKTTKDQYVSTVKLDNSYINKSLEKAKIDLDSKGLDYIVLGDGEKIINQYPTKESILSIYDKVLLLTNGNKIIMPNIIGWSSSEVNNLVNMLNIDLELQGYGYVTSQSIASGTVIMDNSKLSVILQPKYGIE